MIDPRTCAVFDGFTSLIESQEETARDIEDTRVFGHKWEVGGYRSSTPHEAQGASRCQSTRPYL